MKKYFILLISILLILAFSMVISADEMTLDESTGDSEDFSLSIDLGSDSIYSDDLVSVGGNLDVKGTVDGDVIGIGALVYINGHITGDLVLIGSSGEIDSNTVVDGEFITLGSFIDMDENVELSGPVTHVNLGPFQKFFGLKYKPSAIQKSYAAGSLISSIAKFIAIFLLGSLVLLLFKKFKRIEETIVLNPLRAFLIGLLAEILIIPAILVLTISIIGIPFIPVFILIIFIGVFIGSVILIHMLGSFIFNEFKKNGLHFTMNLLLGLLILSLFPLLSKIGMWFSIDWLSNLFGIISFIQWYIIITYAFGVMVLTRFGTRIYNPRLQITSDSSD